MKRYLTLPASELLSSFDSLFQTRVCVYVKGNIGGMGIQMLGVTNISGTSFSAVDDSSGCIQKKQEITFSSLL